MKFIFRLIFYFFIILVIFAIVPTSFWNWLKPYFNWQNLIKTFSLGWQKLATFIKGATGIDFSGFGPKIKTLTGIDFSLAFEKIRLFLSNIFTRLAGMIK
ncbi:MAG: hypothetical protein M1505_01455 [Patescibacteria group bacterium]|nr:hypothetical protein [Patescibacteria group bacterium]MCL5257880.1 hypothetical protein [Patescibacteria group bacterium]